MASLTDPIRNRRVHREDCSAVLPEKEAVARELDSILNSSFFRATRRAKQFLAYVVKYKLEGNTEPLKERIIGADLFKRPADYSTGDDAVVRVQAGDVRRRLEQYYHATPNHNAVRIELPVGSYSPEFVWTQAAPAAEKLSEDEPPHPSPILVTQTTPVFFRPKIIAASILVVLLLTASLYWATTHRAKAPQPVLEQFWSPAFSTSEPILICLAKPAVYRPKAELYQMRYPPDQFDTEFKRLEQPPPLKPNDKMEWRDMAEYPEFGVASGDVYAAVQLSKVLGRIGKDTQLRIGGNYSFEDLRNFPAIVVGGFNNKWTMHITSSLHFTFVEENGLQMVREQGPAGRVWHVRWATNGKNSVAAEDYGLVSRLIDSRTGQFVVTVAGITSDGTRAASEFVSNSENLEAALHDAPPNWARKNLQIVVRTAVTDSVPGPPRVAAVYFW
jgi:hypothetical protein